MGRGKLDEERKRDTGSGSSLAEPPGEPSPCLAGTRAPLDRAHGQGACSPVLPARARLDVVGGRHQRSGRADVGKPRLCRGGSSRGGLGCAPQHAHCTACRDRRGGVPGVGCPRVPRCTARLRVRRRQRPAHSRILKAHRSALCPKEERKERGSSPSGMAPQSEGGAGQGRDAGGQGAGIMLRRYCTDTAQT